MTREEMDHSRKRRNETHIEKREVRRENDSFAKSSHNCKSVVKKRHHKEDADHKRHHHSEKETFKHPPRRHPRPDDGRREWRHRNSPVELIVQGCRNTDSSSTSEESDGEHKQDNEKQFVHCGKRQHDETFEELSRRKRKIESELNALDAEEAAAKEADEKRQRSNNRNHKRTERSGHHHMERLIKVKQEPMSDDDDRRRRNQHSSHHRNERPVRIKQEPSSDDERRRRRHRSPETRRPRAGSRSQKRNAEWGHAEEPQQKQKEKPNFQTSGKLAEDTNMFNGVVINYNEPSEARKPKRKWRLYPFKGDVSMPFIPVHRQSAYLLGRTRHIADIPIDHPSCSKQHAVLQFRVLPYVKDDGTKGRSVRPYVIDLDSSNGTYVNNKRITPRCYVELFEKDVLKFGFSTRVYVILHEDSKNENDDDGEAS